ncbi:MAG: TIGR03960 family B12-binding radical SAM protein [Lachnospiraceae bacterium]
MNKLALSEEILLKVEKPARYIGGEYNAVVKDPAKVKTRIAMCFPDVYEIGMSHLGMQILYDMYNQREDIWCERVFSPWLDLYEIMKREHIPLFGLESQDPIKDFDFVGITIQYEMCYTNILQILDLAQIPLLACDRSNEDPIIIGGGPCTYNPEPIADFFDLFYIGEGEINNLKLVDLYQECRAQGFDRKQFLMKASQIPGIYVPSLYEVTYHEDQTIASFTPVSPEVPATVRKVAAEDLSSLCYPEKPIVPFIKVTQDRGVLEVMRGCIRGCRFCQAGMVYRPRRERKTEDLLKLAESILKNTGHEELSLSSLSTSDFRDLAGLMNGLIDHCNAQHVNLSLPSLRIDSFSLDIMSKVQDIKKSSLTFAPEAGTQRMRNLINKGLTEEDILDGSRKAFLGGWTKVKLYFMLGLPTETVEDMEGIAELANKIAAEYFDAIPKPERKGSVQITSSTSFFIPKPFTPLQWAPMCEMEEYIEKAVIVKRAMKNQLNQKRLSYQWHSPEASILEGIFARGDRRVGGAILKAYQEGCIYDAWSEQFDYEKWMGILAECGLDYHFYTTRERSLDEIFPWDFIDAGVSKKFLIREWKKAMAEEVTPNCAEKCAGCSADRYSRSACHGEHHVCAGQGCPAAKSSSLNSETDRMEGNHEDQN